MKYWIKTFGCQQNVSDSERIRAALSKRGMIQTDSYKDANYIIINTCMVRQSAENRVIGLVKNLAKTKEKEREKGETSKIIVTGCMVGLALRDLSGKYFQTIRERMPEVDEFMPIEKIGSDLEPVRSNKTVAWIPISNGCNNFCTYCVVPHSRGREISRPYDEIIREVKNLKKKGYREVLLLGQNVNSYGSDLIKRGLHPKIKPIYVKHLGKERIPTLFPYLLKEISEMGFDHVSFISSNPWDFSDELIDVITKHKNIARTIHLPVQSGDSNVLKRMNRWYTSEEYLDLLSKIRKRVPGAKFTTDIIVGFCGETEKEFKNTVKLCKKAGFRKAYIAMYSPRFGTAADKLMEDDVPYAIKKERWCILENLINKPKLTKRYDTIKP